MRPIRSSSSSVPTGMPPPSAVRPRFVPPSSSPSVAIHPRLSPHSVLSKRPTDLKKHRQTIERGQTEVDAQTAREIDDLARLYTSNEQAVVAKLLDRLFDVPLALHPNVRKLQPAAAKA